MSNVEEIRRKQVSLPSLQWNVKYLVVSLIAASFFCNMFGIFPVVWDPSHVNTVTFSSGKSGTNWNETK